MKNKFNRKRMVDQYNQTKKEQKISLAKTEIGYTNQMLIQQTMKEWNTSKILQFIQ